MKPELSLSLQFADPRHRAQLPRHKVQRFVRAALELEGALVEAGPGLGPGESVRCCRGGPGE